MVGRVVPVIGTVIWASSLVVTSAGLSKELPRVTQATPHPAPAALFEPGDTCMVCHNNLVNRAGEDVSIGADWRASMMANSARDPYWLAAVRRETMDYPAAQTEIEDECSVCHMPMTTFPERAAGRTGRVFDHMPLGRPDDPEAVLAGDGVSCTVCHQIQPTNLGNSTSFNGGYVIDVSDAPGTRRIFGPFLVDTGRTRVMQSSTGFVPTQSVHVQQSELCATCHTLFTHAMAPGADDARLPEQTPYLEWQQSSYQDTMSCQTCHMPVVDYDMPLSQVLGQPRAGFSRHSFRGGNFFMLRMLNRYRVELGVRATPQEMTAAIGRTVGHLQEDTATIAVVRAERAGETLAVDVDVENLAGHKLPTAYPSRRVWIRLLVRDASGRVLFESGGVSPTGQIAGNDNDDDASRFESHHTQITTADQVQIYESVMTDPSGLVTTGLLSGVRYVKDNRLLPRGMTSATATAETAVHGAVEQDPDFGDGRDRVAYRVPIGGGGSGPLTVSAELWYQPIGYRWAENFRGYDAPETKRFIGYWDAMASESALTLSTAVITVR